MIKNLVNVIKEQAEHIKNIKSFKYQSYDLINAQNNNSTIQIVVENNHYIEYLVTKDLIKVTINIDILDNFNQGDDEANIHDKTFKVGIVLLKLIQEKYKDIISIYDYDFIAVSDWTDDALSGERMTLTLAMPSPINACNINDFIDETNEYDKYEDKPIDVKKPQIDINDIDINPIKLK